MQLITFATYEEAQGSLDLFKAKEIKRGFYESDIGYIAITGIGPFAAFYSLQNINFDQIVNIGLAGSLRDDIILGSIHPVASCQKHAWHPKGTDSSLASDFPTLILENKGLRLRTLDFPLYNGHDSLRNECDLIDMEGYGIALIAKTKQKPCKLYKLVSDYCNKESSLVIKNKIDEYSRKIALYLKGENLCEPAY